ncbi:hypothetical protein FRC03_011529 [Tulasnella sp. 419]|nr:hypothetical protein FRC02_008500 [Tulasnella sp. 418]KAG8966694.1 hypothetical protein FRC03_011529 [Tulasnella sp. 419]
MLTTTSKLSLAYKAVSVSCRPCIDTCNPKTVLALRSLASVAPQKSTSKNLNSSPQGNPEDSNKAYERVPGWYFRRWIWLLIGFDVVWTANAVDLTFNNWTEKIPPKEKDGTPKYELKSLWARLPACTVISIGGAALATGMLLMRRRVVRKIEIRPNKRVYVETAADGNGKGILVEKSSCDLRPGRDESEMIMNISGYKGDYWLGLKGATVAGLGGSNWDIRRRLHEKWFGVQLHGRWASGRSSGAWM